MKVQDFSVEGIKNENCHCRTKCDDSDRVTDYISINLLILKSNWKIKSNCGHPNQSYSAVLSFGAILMFIMRRSNL